MYARRRSFARFGRLIKTSWRFQAKEFFRSSTLHGVRYIAEFDRPLLERFMWFCFVVAGAVATVMIIVSLWDKFQTNPTITGLDTDFHSWDVPFPALTLCENSPGNHSYVEDADDGELAREFLRKLAYLDYDGMVSFAGYAQEKQLDKYMEADLKKLAYKVVSRCEDVIGNCVWKTEPIECCEHFYPLFTENGFCYTFNAKEHERSWPGKQKRSPDEQGFEPRRIEETDAKWAFSFESASASLLVYLHSSLEVPTLDWNPQHVWDGRVDKISFSVKETYTTDDARQLSVRQRRCIFADEVRLQIDGVYTYTACTRQCRMETSRKLCGCVPFFYPPIDGFRHCTLREMPCVAASAAVIRSEQHCGCELGCSNTVYEVEKLNERVESGNDLVAEFVSWPMVRYKREVLFGWVDLLVSFGGIAGLFLGFSLLSGVEIIYYFTVRAFCMLYTERDEVEDLADKNVRSVRRFNNPVFPKQTDKWFDKDVIKSPFGIEFLH